MAIRYKDLYPVRNQEDSPSSEPLYELIIFGNDGARREKGEPDLILKRAVAGTEPAGPSGAGASSGSDAEAPEQAEEKGAIRNNEPPGTESDTEYDKEYDDAEQKDEPELTQPLDTSPQKPVTASSISDYLSSLNHHVTDDVKRVVDAIIATEQDMTDDGIKDRDIAEQGMAGQDATEERVEEPSIQAVRVSVNQMEHEETSEPSGTRGEPADNASTPVQRVRPAELDRKNKTRRLSFEKISAIIESIKKSTVKNSQDGAGQKGFNYTNKVEYEDR